MALTLTQKGRPLRFTTPLGADRVLLERLTGAEAISKPYEFTLELLSLDTGIDPKSILRKAVTIELDLDDGSTRYINGAVRRFTQHGRAEGLVTYHAEVVPMLWFLSLSADCRVWQNKTVPDIVKQVLSDAGITDFKNSVTTAPGPREFCVQYRETHLDFVSRLLEEEGLFYFFEHTKDKHTMVIADTPSAVKAGPVTKLTMSMSADRYSVVNTIMGLEVGSQVCSGKVVLVDYNDTTAKRLESSTDGGANGISATSIRVFDYPGNFGVKADGDRFSRLRMEESEATSRMITARTNSRGVGAGLKVDVADHYRRDVNQSYQIVSVRHEGHVGDYRAGSDGEAFSFECVFTGIPASVPYRPARQTPRPIVHGSQTAVVVGPKGEEIYVDKYGRVKVQFFWDQLGKLDENSSCWVRVSSSWAGKNWGAIQIPRIGQEVIVDFLEGDPDRPIITGRVYNGEMMPPYTLPANGTQSGVKSRSSKSGATTDFNEIRFEDKKDSEEIFMHAQKDLNVVIENAETRTVNKSNRTTTIKKGNDEKTVTEGFEKTTISKGNRDVIVTKGNQTHKVDEGNDTTTIGKGDQTLTITKGKQTVTIEGERSVTIKTGNEILTVKTGSMKTNVDTGNHETTVKAGNVTLKANAGSITIQGMQSIELKCGPSSIKIAPDGVTIKGPMVKVQGSAMAEIKAPMATVSGDGMLTLKGGVTMIN